ncbi:alpha/beta fold hydrolase [Spongiibacter taiwanensis]|uniref:alpha/beta fold hydrolase n=1 Tax=Spongiibacter taiwanensis TaxID=1748242 RepID=UPI002034D256|nr:alpha/beta fold hydrolase [Spongiibacter taiwanensis]USA43136.1 alpha/beta fold hydrolase [Spongiibacter taiwanensis]
MRRELATGTVTLHADTSGSGDETVVLLHGLFGSSSNLMALARSLEPFFTVVRMDLRNHGKSAHSDSMALRSLAKDVCAKLNEMNIDAAHLVGHSLGGKVAMEMALAFPARVKRLVVADIAPVAYGRGHDQIFAGLFALDLRNLESRQQADRELEASVPELAIRSFLLKNLIRADGGGWAWRMNLTALAEDYDAIRAAPEAGVFDGPTLFIRGGASDYVLDEHRVLIQRQFPQVEIQTVAEAGHWLHAEKPQVFNEMVLQFLRGHGNF